MNLAQVVKPTEIDTARLRLRQWRAADREPFAALNADPMVMEFFPALLSLAESDALASRCEGLIAERGWGLWAVEIKKWTGVSRLRGFASDGSSFSDPIGND